jgi:integrase
MASSFVVARKTKSGARRFVVRYRLGGRAWPVEHGGSFSTMKEARARRDLIAGELAAGRNPADVLRLTPDAPVVTFTTWCERFTSSRIDVDASTTRTYGAALRKAGEQFAQRDPATITAPEVAEWVAQLAQERKSATVRLYVVALRMLFDFAGVEPNPARDARVRLPKNTREEPNPPSAEHWEAIVRAVDARHRLPLVVVEQGGMRVGEAISLRWGDVDAAGSRLRLRRSATKRDKARWVQLPAWLVDAVEATCPLEDRTPERKVFQGVSEDSAYRAMARACKLAKVPHYHPHDLRDRRLTIWHHAGVPAREVAHRAGHARTSESLDTYTHVVPVAELADTRYRELIDA